MVIHGSITVLAAVFGFPILLVVIAIGFVGGALGVVARRKRGRPLPDPEAT